MCLDLQNTRGNSKVMSQGGRERATKSVDLKWWQRLGRGSLSIVMSPILFFVLIIYFVSLCHYLHVLMSFKNFHYKCLFLNICVLSFGLLKRRPWCNRKQTKFLSFYKKVVHFVSESGTPLRNFAENLSIFLQSSSRISAEHLPLFLKNTII